MQVFKKMLYIIGTISVLSTTSYAGVPTVDGGSITQSITNTAMQIKQQLEAYKKQVDAFKLQKDQFIQEQLGFANDIRAKVNEGQQWLQEQQRELASAVGEFKAEYIDPVTGAMTATMSILDFSKTLESAEAAYSDLVNSLIESEHAYVTVGQAIKEFKDVKNPLKRESLKRYKEIFGDLDEKAFKSECTYGDIELNSCALKWGNRMVFVEGVLQTERNMKNILNKSKQGLVEIASRKEEHKVQNVTDKGKEGIGTETNVEMGTTSKQQLEGANIIADAGVALQKEVASAQTIERDFKKRDALFSLNMTKEKDLIKALYAQQAKEKATKEDADYLKFVENYLDTKIKKGE